jgi:hypothetical protein
MPSNSSSKRNSGQKIPQRAAGQAAVRDFSNHELLFLAFAQIPFFFSPDEVTYIESWKAIELANETFAFNGWSCSVVDITPDFVTKKKREKKRNEKRVPFIFELTVFVFLIFGED